MAAREDAPADHPVSLRFPRLRTLRSAACVDLAPAQLSAVGSGGSVLGEEVQISGPHRVHSAVQRQPEGLLSCADALRRRAVGGKLRGLPVHRHRPAAVSAAVLRSRREFLLAHRQHAILLKPDGRPLVPPVCVRTGVRVGHAVHAGARSLRAQPVVNRKSGSK